MKVIIKKDYEAMSKQAAQIIARQILMKPDSVLGLATGSTPLGTYKKLIEMYDAGLVDFSRVTTFNLDEYWGISPEHPQSYRYFMDNNLFNHININKENTHVPVCSTNDIEKECIQYENRIIEHGGIDLQLLGIGHNGHIGFNEPGALWEGETSIFQLSQETIKSNSRFFENMEEVPKKAITMGIKTIMKSRKIILIATGTEKSDIIRQAVKGQVTNNIPASILQIHPDSSFIVDEQAAGALNSLNK